MKRKRRHRLVLAYVATLAMALLWVPLETTETSQEVRYRSHFDLRTGTLQRTEHPETLVETSTSWGFSWQAVRSPKVSVSSYLALEVGGLTALFGLLWLFSSASSRDPV